MTNASHLPLALYKANLELWLRVGQLLEDNREQWADLLAHELNERMAAARGEAGRFRAGGDWPSMAMLPGSELWRLAEQQVDDLQALAQTASGNQMTFVNGFQQALEQWQQATAAAFGEAAGEATVPAQPFQGLRETLEGLSNALLSGIAAGTPAAAAAPRKAAPVRRAAGPARKATGKTAAKKATRKAPKKAAPKKTARKAAKKATKKAAGKTARRTARKSTAR